MGSPSTEPNDINEELSQYIMILVLDFCYTSKFKLFKTLNEFTHGLGP